MMEFVIDRNTWRSGDYGRNAIGEGETYLLNGDGFMCCIGQCCFQMRVRREALLGRSLPICMSADKNKIQGIFLDGAGNSTLTSDAARINDDTDLTLEQREESLIKLFKKHGHTLRFEGEPVIKQQ